MHQSRIKLGEVKKQPFDLPYYNNTNYPLALKNNLENDKQDPNDFLLIYQFIVKEFFTRVPQQRGLLICHEMGIGKTLLAASIANYFREIEPKRNIIIMLSKSLEKNFKAGIVDYITKW